jgi:hypothetical protein
MPKEQAIELALGEIEELVPTLEFRTLSVVFLRISTHACSLHTLLKISYNIFLIRL